ncbi:hypothetical protein EMIHUDRAFT_253633 [Emiliania huxleyi CCMP1516]|uniref:Uncharacterized protein n=2 Tax=Emiliania huxleyi TaxID=2903 RepID=A0A0D3K511_EMIH1|nr:hypothetical protein EMIHUDRAFT_253633 [Emiliania huxleyi CCMP1516]EOD30846.1 hypothetical protein EMIHUDRAFT_253633 [Emiliania huxleyi CCMP1516]|eukprot:XP_005783275.1 hypothetical protein EMIHUDRAFT_253633 [Emiliania huxleyi CCMP1516]
MRPARIGHNTLRDCRRARPAEGLPKPGIGVDGAKAIAEALQGNEVLKKLNLDGHELDLPKLRGTDPVESLDLSSWSLGPASAIVIASLIAGNGVLKRLHLGRNYIGDEGAKAIGGALAVNGVLKNINLSYNNLGDEGRKAIHDAVSGREGFELEMVLTSIEIDLRGNKFGDEGKKAIQDAVSGREGFKLEM